jgi:tRNA threonylcarbamoyladenosine biosynthesis protein TsaE
LYNLCASPKQHLNEASATYQQQRTSEAREIGSNVPILREGELDIISHSVEQTTRLGVRLGQLLQAGDIICLSGDMGAGKTVFSGGIGRGWGSLTPITSPTYNLVHQHQRDADKVVLYHLDCYRLQGIEDTDSIGLDDMLDSEGVIVFEWAERILDALPKDHLWVDLRVVEETRRNFVLEAHGTRYEKLIQDFRAKTFGS